MRVTQEVPWGGWGHEVGEARQAALWPERDRHPRRPPELWEPLRDTPCVPWSCPSSWEVAKLRCLSTPGGEGYPRTVGACGVSTACAHGGRAAPAVRESPLSPRRHGGLLRMPRTCEQLL